ncbi:MAG: PadR family transcriptional regulator [Chloroflexaceae bacterium]|jgi:PadR family transcriptional regulator PadR|nr:PadR family transcriptional regulator [Chloroflexaceae bacterium]
MNPSQREMLKGSLDLMLLVLLETEPMYGYQMVKEVRERSGAALQLKEGSLYPALHRLEQAGLIEGYWQRRDDGADRRYYRLSAAGRAALPERKAAWQQFTAAVNGVLSG